MPAPAGLKQRLAALIDQAWDDWKANKDEVNISELITTDSRSWKLHIYRGKDRDGFILRILRKPF